MDNDALTDEIDPKNHAEDPDTAKKAVEYVKELADQARSERVALMDDWRSQYNIWDEFPDVKYYDGRADLYYPVGHRAVERIIARQTARLFPIGDDFIDVKSIPPGEEGQDEVSENSDAAKALVWYDLNQHLHIRRRMPVFLRQRAILGTSVLALDYITGSEAQGRGPRRQFRLAKGEQAGTLGRKSHRPQFQIGPIGRIVDLFTWYAWPASIDELDEAVIQFEDELVTWADMQAWKKQGRYLFDDADLKKEAFKAPEHSVWSQHERLQQRGISDQPNKALFVLTRAYCDWNPKGEDEEPIPFEFAIVGELAVLVRQNQQWHQQSPYLLSRMMPYVGELYGRGPIHFIKKLQYQVNDTANQTMDGMSYSLNPICLVDPLAIPDPALLQYRTGAMWPATPNAIRPLVIPDTHKSGFDAIRQFWEVAQEVTGAATGGQYLPTVGIARGANTATGQSLLFQAADVDLAIDVTMIEEELLEPLCHRLDLMEQQYLPEGRDRILRAMGPKAIPLLRDGMRVRRETMLGTRTYTWTGGVVSEQREQFQKVGPSILEIVAKIQPSPDGRADIWKIVKNLYRSFGFSDGEDIFHIKKQGPGYDPQLEHAVMRAGHPIDPMPGEAYMAHLVQHETAVKQAVVEGWFDRLSAHMAKTIVLMRENPVETAPIPGAQPGMPPGIPQPGAMPAVPQNGPGMVPQPPANLDAFMQAAQAGRAQGAMPSPTIDRVERDSRGLVSRIIRGGAQ